MIKSRIILLFSRINARKLFCINTLPSQNSLLLLAFCLLAGNIISQSITPSSIQFIDLDANSSCYLKAIKEKEDGAWEIKLMNFFKEGVTDTVFTHQYLEADTILQIILIKVDYEYRSDKLKKIKEFDHYTSFVFEVKKSLERLQLTYSKEILSGNLRLVKKVKVTKNTTTKIVDTSYTCKLIHAIRKSLHCCCKKHKTHSEREEFDFTIQSIDIVFQDGFIDNISVTGSLDNKKDSIIQFKNIYPIGISSKKNIDKLQGNSLYSNHYRKSYKLQLTDFFNYEYIIEKNQYDLSPSDTLLKVEFKENESLKNIQLKKDDKNKIFAINTFSDFIGLNEETPNGLVQIEAHRKIKLYSQYYCQRFPIGFFHYIEPSFKWNKIENKNAFLTPLNNDTYFPVYTTQNGVTDTTYTLEKNRSFDLLNLFQYQQLSVGLNLNLISGFNGNAKIKYTLDGVFNYGRVKVRDSIYTVNTTYSPFKVEATNQEPNEFKINTIQWGLDFKMQFLPDARYGFTVGAKYLNIYLADVGFRQQNRTYQNKWVDDKYLNRGIFSSNFQIHKNFDNDSKFYIRYVFNTQINNFKYNFSQFQIGYNVFLKF